MDASLTSELAAWGASVRWSSLPATVREATVCRLVDSIGLMLAGSATPAGRAVLDYATSSGGTPAATLLGSGERLPAASVALVHGTWAHVHDYDDTEPESVIHPTSPVAAAVLAVGEASGSSPEEILAAAAVGIEVMCRLGAPAGRRFHHRGFHATGLAGPIAVALAASTITGSSPDATVSAMGLAGSMSGGLLAFLSDGSWAKRLHPGWAAHGGVIAAGLAARGFTGPAGVLEDRYGTYAAFLHGEVVDHAAVVDSLGTTWRSLPPHFKRFPCAHVIQPFLDAVLEGGIRAGDAAEIVLRLPTWQVPIVCEPWDT
jgi:2-methylcitrate dehydratase PrpD